MVAIPGSGFVPMKSQAPISDLVQVRHLAAIVAASDDAIFSKDRDAIIRSWNPGAERLYGWSAEEAVGRSVSILIPPHRSGEERMVLERILRGERLEHYETERVCRDGRPVWVSLTISPVRDETDEIVAASVISRDITEQRAAQHEREVLLVEAQSARLAAERSRGRLALLNRVSDVLASSLDLQANLDRFAALVAGSFGELCAIHLVVDRGVRLIAATPDWPDDSNLQLAREEAIDTGTVVVAATQESGTSTRQDGMVPTALVAPIPSRSGCLGALTSVAQHGDAYDADDVELMREIARRAGLAIESSLAYEAEHAVALTLQRSLLPQDLSQVAGLKIAARYLPAAPNLNVGGDWYDVLSGSDGSVLAAIGDVAGHGLNAAATMGQLRTVVRAYAFDGSTSASLLDRLNRFVGSTHGVGMATLALVTFPPERGSIEVSRAGHPSPMLRRADGSTQWLTGPAGFPIGAVSACEFERTSHPISPGDTILLFTDGLIERRGERLDDGIARLTQAIEEAPNDLETMCDSVLERMTAEQLERRDDIALLALRVADEDQTSFSFRQAARPSALAVLRRRLTSWLDPHGLELTKLNAIITACNEAASNVIEHAYLGHDGLLEILGSRGADGTVELVVRDSGEWRQKRQTGGGRGRKIIAALCDEVDFLTGPSGTVVTMRHHGHPGSDV